MNRVTRLAGGLLVVMLLGALALPASAAHRGGDGDGWCGYRWWRCPSPTSTTTTTQPAPAPTSKPTTTTTAPPKPTTTTTPPTTTTAPPTTTTTMPPPTTTTEPPPDPTEVVALVVLTANDVGPGDGPTPPGVVSGDRPGTVGDIVVSLGSDFVDVVLDGLGLSLLAILIPLLVAVWLTVKDRNDEEAVALSL